MNPNKLGQIVLALAAAVTIFPTALSFLACLGESSVLRELTFLRWFAVTAAIIVCYVHLEPKSEKPPGQ